MSQTTVNLGYVLKNRGEYIAEPETRYYHDNVVQYQGSSFIADPVDYNPETNPLAYVTTPPYDADPNQPNEGWKVFASDAAYVNSFIFFTENPEWAYVVCDNEDKILFGVKQDGEFYFGAGCPPQVKSYIEEKISALSLDEYESIVAFLDGLIGSDTTLKMMLDSLEENKVDKEEGKSLIDAEYASTKSAIDNPEFIEVTTDSDDKILEGIKKDGTKVIGGGLNVGGSASVSGYIKVLGSMEVSGVSYEVIKNPEYLAAWLDESGKVLFGLKADGKTYVGDADFLNEIKNNQEAISNIQSTLASISSTIEPLDIDALSSITAVENPEFIEAKTDSEGKILAGRTPDGAAFEHIGFSTPKVSIDGHTIENIEDPEGRSEIITDSEGKIISYRDSEGVKHEEVGIDSTVVNTNSLKLSDEGMTEFQQALKDAGFQPGGTGDWSDYLSEDGDNPLHIPIPECAVLNILSDYDLTQLSKKGYSANPPYWPAGVEGVTFDIPTEVEFYDMQGNYFKKKVLMSAQGNSSMDQFKKNIALDFFDGDYDGSAFSVKFGNWVPQDSFHLKAFATDFFRGVSITAYNVAMAVESDKSISKNRTWKKALIGNKGGDSTYDAKLSDLDLQLDSDARCVPDAFPVIVYQNGEFWGIFAWCIKKHRDNYHMSKKKATHIHLDGNLTLFDGNIDWTQFEVRNPKNLVYAEAHSNTYKYDSDIPGQLEIAGNNDGSMTYDTWAAGSYQVNKIVKHNSHYYLNTIEGNTAEPVYDKKNNGDDAPDFKNKTGCGWINVTNTVKVKASIIALSKRCGEIDAAGTPEEKKQIFDTYFDAENLYEYDIVQAVVGDYDGYFKNWQWTTWDGIKWFVNNYDKDCSFGANAEGTFITQPNMIYPVSPWILNFNSSVKPLSFIQVLANYQDQKIARYNELRRKGIISVENIVNTMLSWCDRIGLKYYEKEYSKWNDQICNRELILDEHWELYKPADSVEYFNIPEYSDDISYNVGDICKLRYYLCFKAKSIVSGTNPVVQYGHKDNIYRFENWVRERIALLDDYCGFQN